MACTSNIQNSPSSLSSSCSEYEVFLSFGDDTRNNFTDHLYHALASDKGIIIFRDNEGLDRGKPISLEVLNAIEKSRIAIIIFSQHYASSTRRLEELAKIVECRDARRMRVLPIFYHVEPSDVRYLKGTFADAFAKHERLKENIEKMQRWRAALRSVADLSGYHLKDGHESMFIHRFVEEVSSQLNDMIESVYKDKYVGIESCVEEIVNLCIDMESSDVRFIGICGMSGIGKTTLAEVVFERIHRQFQASSFLKDVKRRNLSDSQDQLLRDMRLKSEIPRWDELKAINTTSYRLRNKKVIIVVDDADEEKLEKLAGHRNWFGRGSKIILTTEDEGMLEKRCGEKNVYQAKKLNASDALELFIREAFNESPCEEDLLNICNDFVSYADGNPQALKSLGSSMHDLPLDLWHAKLERLRESDELREDRIQTVLGMRYKGLRTLKNYIDHEPSSIVFESSSESSSQSDSNPKLKRQLNSLLSRLYQGDPAQNYWYDYIFPQISIPTKWFNYQNFLSEIRMQLPPDLHNNTRWMGFSVYALYNVDKQPAVSGQDSTIFLSCSGLSAADEAPFAPYMAFPRSRDVFVGSRRLLVFYIPRVLFRLNRRGVIWASFQSKLPGGVKIEMCGIRLVYEQDIEEFVETLVQCMLECPDEYHESYHQNLLAQVAELQGCDHGKDFG